jgi:CRP/FNR family transcriptional regulator
MALKNTIRQGLYMTFVHEDIDLVLAFLNSQSEVKNINVPANTIVANEGERCLNFSLVLKGKIKVYKTSEEGKLITLYYINKNEGCILTSASILNNAPFPAMAVTVSDCEIITFPANRMFDYFDKSKVWRKYIFSLISNKMTNLLTMVDDLAFHKLDARLYGWLQKNHHHGVVDATHQVIAEQLASSREVISRLLKSLEKKGLISLSRGKIKII